MKILHPRSPSQKQSLSLIVHGPTNIESILVAVDRLKQIGFGAEVVIDQLRVQGRRYVERYHIVKKAANSLIEIYYRLKKMLS